MKPTFEQLPEMVQTLLNEVRELRNELINKPKKEGYLSRAEVAELLKRDIDTIRNWAKKGLFNEYQLEGSIYYLESEIEKVVLNNKVKTH